MQFWAMVVDSFRESRDRRIFWILLVISGVVALAMCAVGFEQGRVSLLFGLWNPSTDHYDPLIALGRSRIIGLVIYGILDNILGGVGLVLMVIATAGALPAMMDRGAIDVLLSKPLRRSRLFLWKYISVMVFAAFQAGVFVVLTFLVMGLKWGVWVPAYLLSIPLVVLVFSYVYCVSALVAVKTRSAVACVLLSLGVWMFSAMVSQAPVVAEMMGMDMASPLGRMMRAVSWIPPKTGDLPYLVARWSEGSSGVDILPPDAMQTDDPETQLQTQRARAIDERELRKNPWLSIGSSLLFESVVVLLAMWIFARTDF